jgi:hypothetical protein
MTRNEAAMVVGLPLEDQPHLLDEHGPLFITGCPRSGTTFLSGAINAVRGIEQFNGVLAPPRMMHWIGKQWEAGHAVDEELRIMRDIFWNSFIRRATFLPERVGAVIRSRRGLFDMRRPGAISGRKMLYKEPFIAFAMTPVVAHFAGSCVLHIIRDGRDNANSLVQSYPDALSDRVLADPFLSSQKNSEIGCFETVEGFNYPWWVAGGERELFRTASKYVRNIMLWREMTRRIIAASSQLPAERYLEVRYEDMIRDQAGTAKAITAFLGGSDTRPLERALAQAHGTSIGLHRKNQSASEIAMAERIVGPFLAELGYA